MTQVHDEASNPTTNTIPPSPPPTDDPDLPAESFFVVVDQEIDWIDQNAVYDRDDSTKGTTNPKTKSQHSNTNTTTAAFSTSQRFSINLKSLGLPNVTVTTPRKQQLNIFPGTKSGNRNMKKGSDDDGDVQEPVSPKVSCIGRVRSERGRSVEGFWSCCGVKR